MAYYFKVQYSYDKNISMLTWNPVDEFGYIYEPYIWSHKGLLMVTEKLHLIMNRRMFGSCMWHFIGKKHGVRVVVYKKKYHFGLAFFLCHHPYSLCLQHSWPGSWTSFMGDDSNYKITRCATTSLRTSLATCYFIAWWEYSEKFRITRVFRY